MSEERLLGYKGIFNGYTVKRNLLSWKSLLVAVVTFSVSVFLFFSKGFEDSYILLSRLVDVLLNCLPDLLGFCIGGYAIVVAINSLEKMPFLLEKQERTGLSYYVNLSADFAMTLIIMAGLLLASFITRFILDLELAPICERLGIIVNLLFVFTFLLFGTLVFLMIMGTIANLFNISMILKTVAMISGRKDEKKTGDDEVGDNISEMTTYRIKSWLGTYTVTRLVKKH